MHCPFCDNEETKVIDSRLAGEGRQVRRRRECVQCHERFTTFESVRALEKRPVSSEKIEEIVAGIKHRLQTEGEQEVPARVVGEMVMDALQGVDEVAYVRFASVYRSFQDVTEFQDEIQRLQEMTDGPARRDQMSLLPDDKS